MKAKDIVGPDTIRKAMETKAGALSRALDRALYNAQRWKVEFPPGTPKITDENGKGTPFIGIPESYYEQTPPTWVAKIQGWEKDYVDTWRLLAEIRDFLEATAIRQVAP